MMPRLLNEEIYKEMPTSFSINGSTVNVPIVRGREFKGDEFPSVVLTILDMSVPVHDSFTDVQVLGAQQVTDETHTFSAGTLTYDLNVEDVKNIDEITGTLSGSSHTFIKGTDYKLNVDDDVEWLTGGDTPDDGTDFYVDYDKVMVEVVHKAYLMDPVRIDVYTKDAVSGVSPIVTCNEIARSLEEHFEMWDPDNGVVQNVGTVEDVSDVDYTREWMPRRQFDVDMKYLQKFTKVLAPRIAEIEYGVTI